MTRLQFKTEKTVLTILVLLTFLSFGSCTKTPDIIDTTPHTTNTDPAQYGTPFTGVPDARDAVIYQVNMRCFSSTHNFQ